MIGLTLAVSAQKDDQKKPPPKERPPVVRPGDKGPPKPPKGGSDKPGKPGMSWYFVANENETESDRA